MSTRGHNRGVGPGRSAEGAEPDYDDGDDDSSSSGSGGSDDDADDDADDGR